MNDGVATLSAPQILTDTDIPGTVYRINQVNILPVVAILFGKKLMTMSLLTQFQERKLK